MKRHFSLFTLLFVCLFAPKTTIIAQPSHDTFNALISACVTSEGKIDYLKLKSDERQLDDYIAELEKTPPQYSWAKNEEKAYWINAYNAFTLRLILNHYPIKSILLIDGGKAFSKKQFRVGKDWLSLDDIEHRYLRRMGDPRIHFAISCAAQSSPAMPNHVFYARSLDVQLSSATKKYVASLDLTVEKNVITLPKIFDWYAKDFGDVITFINQYGQKNFDALTTIKFANYDWSLNEVTNIVSKR